MRCFQEIRGQVSACCHGSDVIVIDRNRRTLMLTLCSYSGYFCATVTADDRFSIDVLYHDGEHLGLGSAMDLLV